MRPLRDGAQLIIFLLSGALLGGFLTPAHSNEPSQPTQKNCDSCRIEVSSLDSPIPLSGRWLFTREDRPENSLPETDLSHWKTLKTPGPWKKAYDDRKPFEVGWYRGHFYFAPNLIGQDALFLVEAHMSMVEVFLDGTRVFSRRGGNSLQKAYSMQGIPIHIPITRPFHVVTVKVDTILPMGIYHLPFELRKFDPRDKAVAFWQIWGGEIRLITCFTGIFFSIFFIYVARTTRSRFYLFSGLMSLSIAPFFASQTDLIQRFISQNDALLLQHLSAGLPFAVLPWFLGFLKKDLSKRIRILYSVFFLSVSLIFICLKFRFHLAFFQAFQTFLYGSVFLASVHLAIISYKAWRHDRSDGAQLAFFGILLFNTTVVITVLTAADLFVSLGTTFIGTLGLLTSSIIIASRRFAKTFVQNVNLLKEIQILNEGLENKVTARTAELREKNQNINAILQNLPQGILTIVDGGVIHPEYSAYLETILETPEIRGRNAIDLLFSTSSFSRDQIAQAESGILSILGEDELAYEFNAHCLPPEATISTPSGRQKTLEFTWSTIQNHENKAVEKLMVSIRDVTQYRELSRKSAEQKKQLEWISQLIAIESIEFRRFMQSARSGVEKIRSFLDPMVQNTEGTHATELANAVFRVLHTLKGNARTYQLKGISDQAHLTEQVCDKIRKGEPFPLNYSQLLLELDRLESICDEYVRIHDDVLRRRVTEETPTAPLSPIPFDQAMIPLIRSTELLAQELGKSVPKVILTGDSPLLSTVEIEHLRNLFVHLLRNSIDHGIESPDQRTHNGKPAEGTIRIVTQEKGDSIEFRMSDDGQGLNLQKILLRAQKLGLASEEGSLSPHEIAEILFAPGFSTATQVTEISGRGVGLDAVRSSLESIHGSISVQLHEASLRAATGYWGFSWVLIFPRVRASLASCKSAL